MSPPSPTSPHPLPLLALKLQTTHLAELRRFYRDTIGLLLIADSDRSVSFRAGHTTLTFEAVPTPPDAKAAAPHYHYAFNIPENQVDEALEWARARIAIINDATGRENFHFEAWNAHGFYFLDPAGNIVEFIARHTLHNASHSPFTSESIGEVSEIGLVVPDVPAAAAALKAALGITPYLGRSSDEFTAMGDEHGMVILVREGRHWFPLESDQARPAMGFPVELTTQGKPGFASPVTNVPYLLLSGEGCVRAADKP